MTKRVTFTILPLHQSPSVSEREREEKGNQKGKEGWREEGRESKRFGFIGVKIVKLSDREYDRGNGKYSAGVSISHFPSPLFRKRETK